MKRLAIYWKCDTNKAHQIQWIEKLPFFITLNGEQYVDVTDEQYQALLMWKDKGFIEFRNKNLVETPHGLQPENPELYLTNKPTHK